MTELEQLVRALSMSQPSHTSHYPQSSEDDSSVLQDWA